MRVAVSDYDGTLAVKGEVPGGNLAAITKWREMGNHFGLATGRDLGMILHETRRWDIPFDFLVCINGAALYDEELALIKATEIDDAVLPAVLRHPASNASMHIALMIEDPPRVFVRDRASWLLAVDLPHEKIEYDAVMAAKGIRQISLGYLGENEAIEWARQLTLNFSGRIAAHQNGNTIDITASGVDKGRGIKEVISAKGWQSAEVLAIGDGNNDLEMLAAFNGYAVDTASAEAKKAAKTVVASVAEMLGN